MIDPKLIESTARALCRETNDPWGELSDEEKGWHVQDATAVLAHLDTMGALVGDGMVAVPREPTEAMIIAAAGDDFLTAYQEKSLREDAVETYRAMIAASGGET